MGVCGSRGDEKKHVAIRVDRGSMLGGTGAVPGRRAAMCGDPQATTTNRCGFRQCKSGKNRLICSEEPEQLARVSVHCKLDTRATQLGAYFVSTLEGVKSNLFSIFFQWSVDVQRMCSSFQKST